MQLAPFSLFSSRLVSWFLLSDTFQFRSQEEDCSLSREEVKRRSIQLIESQQHKKKAQKSSKKT